MENRNTDQTEDRREESARIADSRKCYEFRCTRYPFCSHAAGSVCALEDFTEDSQVITAAECQEQEAKPLYAAKTGDELIIRRADRGDLKNILPIYAYAREQMKKNGNPTQWGDSRPAESVIRADIETGLCHVLENKDGLCGVFAFLKDGDPETYSTIEDGAWLNEEPYAAVHRVASNGRARGIVSTIMNYCGAKIGNLKIDTHNDNKIMQHQLEKNGFKRCGIVYVDDGTARIAYQKICKQ